MQDRLFDPANEWHDYKGCHLQRSQAVFAAKEEFVFTDHVYVDEICLIDIDDDEKEDSQHDIETNPCAIATNPTPAKIIVGYIILTKRTTLAVFRSILPGTTRFFFLSPNLLRLLQKRRHQKQQPVPRWCSDALNAMTNNYPIIKKSPATCRRPVDSRGINKRLPGCLQHMGAGIYTGLACLVLFDARGPVESCSTWGPMYTFFLTSVLHFFLTPFTILYVSPRYFFIALVSNLFFIFFHFPQISDFRYP